MDDTVSKCCFRFSLKFGFLTFGTICLAFRFAAFTALYFSLSLLYATFDKNTAEVYMYLIPVVGFTLGWMLATTVALLFTLKGIIQERSILLFPYMVLLIIEIILSWVYSLLLSIYVAPYYFIALIVETFINIYTYTCLYSLYKKLKEEEIKKRMVIDIPPSFNLM